MSLYKTKQGLSLALRFFCDLLYLYDIDVSLFLQETPLGVDQLF
jgi:hypothetical protein